MTMQDLVEQVADVDYDAKEDLGALISTIPADGTTPVPEGIVQWAAKHASNFDAASMNNSHHEPALTAWKFCVASSVISSGVTHVEATDGVVNITGWGKRSLGPSGAYKKKAIETWLKERRIEQQPKLALKL
ncbi:hypothetical protein N0V85_007011 [Neurospora sp. IMI 360204]|nr:hypothetical protein N0V85_007011 [Neurospora sp. IMI 360204]